MGFPLKNSTEERVPLLKKKRKPLLQIMLQNFWCQKCPQNKSRDQLSHSGQLWILPSSNCIFGVFLLENYPSHISNRLCGTVYQDGPPFPGYHFRSIRFPLLGIWIMNGPMQELKWLEVTYPIALPWKRCPLVSLAWLLSHPSGTYPFWGLLYGFSFDSLRSPDLSSRLPPPFICFLG